VRQGNYVGQNFGVITLITESEVKLKELIQDSGGDWAERASTLFIEDADQKQEQKK
jgi:type IV pilus assembly protein PilP